MLESVYAVNIGDPDLNPTPGLTSFDVLVNVIVRNSFVFAGIICLFLLIFGGFQVIVAAGDTKKLEKGRGAIVGAVIGLLLVVGSFWIVQIITVITGVDILNPTI